ncbi:hypothetical protein L249_4248, partial [Ophiocordyceps polyrhachis-furcata BCC 54312]
PKARHNALSHSGAIAVIAPDRLVTAIFIISFNFITSSIQSPLLPSILLQSSQNHHHLDAAAADKLYNNDDDDNRATTTRAITRVRKHPL